MRVPSVFALGDAMRPADAPPQEDLTPAPPRKKRAKPSKKVTPKRAAPRKHAPKPAPARARTVTIDLTATATRRFRVLNELIAHLARIKAELTAAFEASPA